jgi:aldehyde:ferredoxin oxidoreductase
MVQNILRILRKTELVTVYRSISIILTQYSMANGYWGKILGVNLSTREISVDEHNEKLYRTYLGGKGIVAHYLLKELPPDCDPLRPENILVFAAGVLTDTAVFEYN